ncbi:MAG TPA: ATP-binding cassette domain-containing protein [Thermoanaerobaculia bacterium]|nr:ATP-binding cassette domain-containing protein [Thermoanaerobaculia bacterium]
MYSPRVIEYRDVTVLAGEATILDRISLAIGTGERVAFLGRSGAGKTTALKVINGLVTPARGELRIDGQALAQQNVVALRRRIGYVMQQPALFPHRTVFENIATVPRLLEWDDATTSAAADVLLTKLELEPRAFRDRHPRGLSGGEQQRVAIARALIASPSILLCDEPFSALDPLIRAELQTLLVDAARQTTLVFVTHDVREAMRIGQRIVVFDAGRIVADTTPDAFASHDHPLVRRFAASVS